MSTEITDDLLLFHRCNFVNPKTGKQVNIYTVRHYGPAGTFENINASLKDDIENGFVVHCEGVTKFPESMHILRKLYADLAAHADEVPQSHDGVPFENHDATFPELPWASRKFLKVFMRLLKFVEDTDNWDALVETVHESSNKNQKNGFTKKMILFFLGGKRERIAMKAAMAADTHVSMVWGSAHLPSFAKKLRRNGFKFVSSEDMNAESIEFSAEVAV